MEHLESLRRELKLTGSLENMAHEERLKEFAELNFEKGQ